MPSLRKWLADPVWLVVLALGAALIGPSPSAGEKGTESEASARLIAAALEGPVSAYKGRMITGRWKGRSSMAAEEVNVYYSPPGSYRYEYLSPSGQTEKVVLLDTARSGIEWIKSGSGDFCEAKNPPLLISPERERRLALLNYRAGAARVDRLLGRAVFVIELTPRIPGKPRQTVWLDKRTHVVLAARRYLEEGGFVELSQFTSFEPCQRIPSAIFEGRQASLMDQMPEGDAGRTMMAEVIRSNPKPLSLPGGFSLRSVDVFEVDNSRVQHFQYTDGLMPLSLFQSERPLELSGDAITKLPDNAVMAEVSGGRIRSWRRKKSHYTLMGDLSPDLIERIAFLVR